MIVADTSAWIEYLRATGSPQHRRLRDLIGTPDVAVIGAIVMEVLAGTPEARARSVHQLLLEHHALRTGMEDYERAAAIFRDCRLHGTPVRGYIDCLVAAVALRETAAVLTADPEFEVIARRTGLRLE